LRCSCFFFSCVYSSALSCSLFRRALKKIFVHCCISTGLPNQTVLLLRKTIFRYMA
jgi:hypothetical protein